MQRPATLVEEAGREGLIGTCESEDGRRRVPLSPVERSFYKFNGSRSCRSHSFA
jgi:hypothetical protein